MTKIKTLRDQAILSTEKTPVAQAAEKIERSTANVVEHILKGNIEAGDKKVQARKTKAGYVQFQRVLADINDGDLCRVLPDESKISLPDAARKSDIPLQIWGHWTRMPKCELLGKKLRMTKERGNADDGKFMPMRHITKADYDAVVVQYKLAKLGRITQKNGTYLSPIEADKDFRIPRAANSSAHTNLAYYSRKGAVGTIQGHYFDRNDKLAHGQMFRDEDLDVLFVRKRPKPVHAKKTPATAPIADPGNGNSQPAALAPDQAWVALGIQVAFAEKTIKRDGKEIEFAKSTVEWHTLLVALNAYPYPCSVEALLDGYPGEKNRDSRSKAKRSLNQKLAHVGLRIQENRELVPIGKTSSGDESPPPR